MPIKAIRLVIILTLTIFCGEALALPFLKCCEMHQDKMIVEVGEMVETHHSHNMEVIIAEMHPSLPHSMVEPGVDVVSLGCELQCNWCLAIYSEPVFTANIQFSNFLILNIDSKFQLFLPSSHPENLFRPPIS